MLALQLLQGYQQEDRLIATQIPLTKTVEEFWKLVVEFNCSTIVCLEDVYDGTKVVGNAIIQCIFSEITVILNHSSYGI